MLIKYLTYFDTYGTQKLYESSEKWLEKCITKKERNMFAMLKSTNTVFANARMSRCLNYVSCSFFFSGRPEPVTLCDRFWRSTHCEEWGLRQHLRERIVTESGKNKVRSHIYTNIFSIFGRSVRSVLYIKK